MKDKIKNNIVQHKKLSTRMAAWSPRHLVSISVKMLRMSYIGLYGLFFNLFWQVS